MTRRPRPRHAEHSPADLALERERRACTSGKHALWEFVKRAWLIIEPDTPLVENWHLILVCDKVQALLEGKLGKRNLIINIPPGSMKSTIVSVCAPAWMWIKNPSWRGLFAAGSDTLALRDSMKCRDILDSDWFKKTFQPTWGFSADQNAKGYYKNTKTGFRRALSAGASVTGDRGHGIFVDDPIDAKKAFSKPAREDVKLWWDVAFANRLNDLQTGTRCIIMQRLHEEDLVGHVLKTEPEAWEVLVIRQEFEPDGKYNSPEDPRKGKGELLFEARFPKSVLQSEKLRLGSVGYAGQHQQRPAPASGNIFKREWFQEYHLAPVSQRAICYKIVQSWDTASKKGKQNDYTVCSTWGITKSGYYLLDVWKDKVEAPELRKQMKALAAKWSPHVVLVEDTSNGTAAIQDLKRDTRLPIIATHPSTDKVERANTASPTVEAGKVYLPESAPWTADLVEEMITFPATDHDDAVDTVTQFINWANSNQSTGEIRLGGSRVASATSSYTSNL